MTGSPMGCWRQANAHSKLLCAARSAVQYALSKGVDVIVAAGNENQNLEDPKFDSSSPNNGNVIFNRPVDLVRPGPAQFVVAGVCSHES